MKKFLFLTACLVLWGTSLWAIPPQPVLTIIPNEIDLGIIRPGKVSHATIQVSKTGEGELAWQLGAPADSIKLTPNYLRGRLQGPSQEIIIAVKYSKAPQGQTEENDDLSRDTVQLMVLCGEDNVRYDLPAQLGSRRVALPFRWGQELQEVGVRYEVSESDAPVLNVEPSDMDFGIVDAEKNPTAQLKIMNRGVKPLRWKISVPVPLQNRGRFISLLNEDVRGRGGYALPTRLSKDLQLLSGVWQERDGFPVGSDPDSALTLGFMGNAVSVAVRKELQGGILTMYLDDKPAGDIDCRSEKIEIVEVPVGGPLLEGMHTLRLAPSAGEVVLTGLRICARDVLTGPPGWIKIFPEAGDTMSEVDFVNIKIQTDRMEPGTYAGTVLVQSDGGDLPLDVSIRVSALSTARILPVYQYVRGMDYLLTTSPEREDQGVLAYYKKQGIAFRLFRDATPGTRRLLRWYHAGKGDHYYANEGSPATRSLPGYIPEGSIGNIASSRLPGTRELYRWFNSKTGLHAYTLDSKGEGLNKRGYTFDGIVGYVR